MLLDFSVNYKPRTTFTNFFKFPQRQPGSHRRLDRPRNTQDRGGLLSTYTTSYTPHDTIKKIITQPKVFHKQKVFKLNIDMC